MENTGCCIYVTSVNMCLRDCEDSQGADGPGHKAKTKVKGGPPCAR